MILIPAATDGEDAGSMSGKRTDSLCRKSVPCPANPLTRAFVTSGNPSPNRLHLHHRGREPRVNNGVNGQWCQLSSRHLKKKTEPWQDRSQGGLLGAQEGGRRNRRFLDLLSVRQGFPALGVSPV